MVQTRGRDLNHVAWLYDPIIEKFSFGLEQKFRLLTLEAMQVRPVDRILDVGCGTGSLTLLAADRLGPAGHIVGIDAAPRMIAIARNKAKKCQFPAEFHAGVAEQLEFSDASFDLVISSMFTHHLDTELKKLAFQEMYRVLKPGGRMVTADIDRPTTLTGVLLGWGARFCLLQPELLDNLQGRLAALMSEAGFARVRRLKHVHGLLSLFACEKSTGEV